MKINFKERTPQLTDWSINSYAVVLIGFWLPVIRIKELQNNMLLDKQELEDEYEAISLQYEGFKFSVQNDSLRYKLQNEQSKSIKVTGRITNDTS